MADDDGTHDLDILVPGDIVGAALDLHGATLVESPLSAALAPIARQAKSQHGRAASVCDIADAFEVVRVLGTGSYAVVYLVREVLNGSPARSKLASEDDVDDGIFELDVTPVQPAAATAVQVSAREPREFALKALSKRNLDQHALAAQLLEATLHQSLAPHPNIVSLHRTLESEKHLLLLLEYVPGQDLFYFLEGGKDSYIPPSANPSMGTSGTPTTPSLLSALHPGTLLSHTRLRLIASMFGQMCDAVAACHAQGVYHRDIKPENFIVTDGWTTPRRIERKVVVKLSDFGLATTEEESSDMDCGSAPYMSFECRNNLAPTYSPRHADVWSLGIVLINMLYHHNPWTDTSLTPSCPPSPTSSTKTDDSGSYSPCESFVTYRKLALEGRAEEFFMERFVGMQRPVARFLGERVFTFLPMSASDKRDKANWRVSASEFGAWARRLPDLFGQRATSITLMTMGLNIGPANGVHGLGGLEGLPKSRRPSRRGGGKVNPENRLIGLRRGGSREEDTDNELATGPPIPDPEIDAFLEGDDEERERSQSRAASSTRRRKRGMRRNRGSTNGSTNASVPTQAFLDEVLDRDDGHERGKRIDDRLDEMVVKSQLLARELSKQGHPSSSSLVLASASNSVKDEKVLKEKKSRWRLLGSSSSSNDATSQVDDTTPNFAASSTYPSIMSTPYTHSSVTSRDRSASRARSVASMGSAASSTHGQAVSNLVMGLAPSASTPSLKAPPVGGSGVYGARRGPSPSASSSTTSFHSSLAPHGSTSAMSLGEDGRGRQRRSQLNPNVHSSLSPPTTPHTHSPWAPAPRIEVVPRKSSANRSNANWRDNATISTTTASHTSSMFTRYSNASARSVDTAATSASGASYGSGSRNWRKKEKKEEEVLDSAPPPMSPASVKSTTSSTKSGRSKNELPPLPANVKMMVGVPWELSQLPRGMHPRPEGDIFGSPPTRKNNKFPKASHLTTINERGATVPVVSSPTSPTSGSWRGALGLRKDASTSTTDLQDDRESLESPGSDGGPRKIHKGQINTLNKILSAISRR